MFKVVRALVCFYRVGNNYAFVHINNRKKVSDSGFCTIFIINKINVELICIPIETGRYYKISRDLRECPLGCKTLGDECHYMTSCIHPFIKDIIEPVMIKLNNLEGGFKHMAPKDKVVFMLGNKDNKILPIVAKFCYKLEEQFKDLTF